MAAPKGHKFTPSRKGIPNKHTAKAKELVMASIDGQSKYFDSTMNKIRAKNPVEWAKIMVKLLDFVMPRKVNMTDEQGNTISPVQIFLPDNGRTIPIEEANPETSRGLSDGLPIEQG